MKGIIRKIYIKHINANNGKKFDKVCIEVDCIDDDNKVKTRTAEMSVDYAKNYFNYCGVSSQQAIGKECDVTLQKRAFEDREGNLRTFESVKYLNLLDEKGERIIMAKDEEKSDLPF